MEVVKRVRASCGDSAEMVSSSLPPETDRQSIGTHAAAQVVAETKPIAVHLTNIFIGLIARRTDALSLQQHALILLFYCLQRPGGKNSPSKSHSAMCNPHSTTLFYATKQTTSDKIQSPELQVESQPDEWTLQVGKLLY